VTPPRAARPPGRAGRTLLAASLGLAVAAAAIGAAAPERVLEAEFARQRLLAGATERDVVVDDHRWRVVEAGEGPLIVLVHGFTGSKENWLPVMRALARTHRVVAPDLPGWGDSERRDGADYGPLAQAARLQAFLATLGARPTLLLGHSMGGQIVGLLAAREPGIAERIGLMSSAGVRFADNDFGRRVLAGENPFEVTDRAELARYLDIVFADPPWVPWPASAALVKRRREDVAFEQQVLDGIGRGPEALLLESQLDRIAPPVLLLWCRDDRVIDVSAAEIFHRGLRDSRTVLLAGCGHMPMMAQPQNVATAIAEFLAAP
jgi:abhydrolase domain-containing protein 6